MQTTYPALLRTLKTPPDYFRQRLSTPDSDFIDIDFCGFSTDSRLSQTNTSSGGAVSFEEVVSPPPLVLLLHGLTGSSQSSYIKGLQLYLQKLGLRSAALNFRGCSGESNNLARSYHSGETEDIQFFYQFLRRREPETPMAAVGFSLGGNVLLKWLSEAGEKPELVAACAVSAPLVLGICATRMDTGLSKAYRNNLINDLKLYIKIKQAHLEKINMAEAEKVKALGNLSRIQSFWEYDDQVVAKLHGFENVHDYYKRCSSRQFLKSITTQTLLIQALDDPFMTPDVLPDKDELGANVQLQVTHHGGHVGFISGDIPFKPHFWLEERIANFLVTHLKQTGVEV